MKLPSPTSGPGVATYIGLVVLVAALLLLVVTAVGPSLHGDVGGLRHGLGLH